MGVANVLNNEHLFSDHFLLLLGHGFVFNHLDCIPLQFSFLAPLEHFAGGASANLLNQFVVSHFFKFTHLLYSSPLQYHYTDE